MKRKLAIVLAAGFAVSAGAQELTWRNDVAPIVKKGCAECHGADGKGKGPMSSKLKIKPADLTILQAILEEKVGYNKGTKRGRSCT